MEFGPVRRKSFLLVFRYASSKRWRPVQMNVSITPELEDYIRRKVATGPYSDPGEVIREAPRLMRDRETGGCLAPNKDHVAAALKALEPELRGRGVISAALFDSIVHGRARPDNDVDVPIGVDPAARFDLIDLVGVNNLLGDHLGREIDLVARDSLKPLLRDSILTEAEAVFGRRRVAIPGPTSETFSRRSRTSRPTPADWTSTSLPRTGVFACWSNATLRSFLRRAAGCRTTPGQPSRMVPWRKIAGIGNILRHDYGSVRPDPHPRRFASRPLPRNGGRGVCRSGQPEPL
ncbi:MAG TPA: nucleotidyltransferase domain-containing protein [Acetobacteraceae bacterium]|nr:nucleotidyltransferase domain-containing protein [Acetobacteraceae bacterium]